MHSHHHAKHSDEHHHRKHHGHHHHDHHHHDYSEDELLYEFSQELDLPKGTELFSEIVSALKENAEIKLSGHLVKPEDNSTFSIWHESTEDDTQRLTLEIEWYAESEEDDADEVPQEIPDISYMLNE